MVDILKEHALKHIWAEPLQDAQHWIKPSRVSPAQGAFKEATVMWEKIPLPNYRINTNSRYHVYPLGQLPPGKFLLDTMQKQTWYSTATLAEQYNVNIDTFLGNGCIVPRVHCYLYLNYDQNFILAVEINDVSYGPVQVPDGTGGHNTINYPIGSSKLTIRFYHNACVENTDWIDTAIDPDHTLKVRSAKVTTTAQFSAFLSSTTTITNSYAGQGAPLYFVGGFVVSKPVGYNQATHQGQTFSYHFDETIKDIRFFNISSIPGFVSILDSNKNKYLLLSDKGLALLDFYDDCDFYLVRRQPSGEYRGVLIDRFNHKAVRQVTHTAWSVTQDSCVYVSNQHEFLQDLNLCSIMVVVRQGGMVKGLGLQSNRVEDLYHLSMTQIAEAMVGVNATVNEWKAEQLENSAYMKVMSSQSKDITPTLVENAYGYNAAAMAVAKSAYPVVDGKVTLDPAKTLTHLTLAGTPVSSQVAFWYDTTGVLLGYTSHSNTGSLLIVPTAYQTAAKVEIINGQLVTNIGNTGNVQDTAVVTDINRGYYGFRNYVCNIVNGAPDNHWVDVTDSVLYQYVIPTNGNPPYIQWNYSLLNAANYYPCTRIASYVNVHTATYNEASYTGVLEHTFLKVDSSVVSPLLVPPGFFTIWMDGKSLIENLDYYYDTVTSTVFIVKRLIQALNSTVFTIRFYGYMNPLTKKPFAPRDVGFVKNGKLSVNSKFNPWHDSDVRVTVNGDFKLTNEVEFIDSGSPVTGITYLDGHAYSVEDYQPVVEPFTGQKTVDYKMQALDIDKRVGDYLTPRLPEPLPENEYITPYRRELYSPVMSYFIQLMRKGMLPDSAIDLELNDESILTQYQNIVLKYSAYDPIILGYDENYVSVYPHPFITAVTVTSKQYAFLQRVNRIFLQTQLDLSLLINIQAGT